MKDLITKTGEYHLPSADYHADPCKTPSLSASLADTILSGTPRHAWLESPRLNPDHEPVEKRAFDIGSAAHEVLLGNGKGVWVIDAENYRTKAAQEARDDARAMGHTPLLRSEADKVETMIRALEDQLPSYDIGNPFKDNPTERTLIWEADGCVNRCMVDCIDHEKRVAYDYKTASGYADPEVWVRRSIDHGVDLRAAHYLDGLKAVHGGEWKYRFVIQEKEAPHLISVVELTAEAVGMGAKKLDRARNVWRWCLERNVWPGWPTQIAVVEAPIFFETKWLEREEREANYRQHHGKDILEMAYAWQAPAAE